MARIHTHYDNLKVARDAPPEVIRAAYKTLSQKHHPDRNGNSPEAIRIIQLINAAYEVLSDPVKRREHDEWIERSESNAAKEPFKIHEAPFTAHVHRHSSRRSRRRRKHFLSDQQRHASAAIANAMHRLRIMLNQFSRKLFGKT